MFSLCIPENKENDLNLWSVSFLCEAFENFVDFSKFPSIFLPSTLSTVFSALSHGTPLLRLKVLCRARMSVYLSIRIL